MTHCHSPVNENLHGAKYGKIERFMFQRSTYAKPGNRIVERNVNFDRRSDKILYRLEPCKVVWARSVSVIIVTPDIAKAPKVLGRRATERIILVDGLLHLFFT